VIDGNASLANTVITVIQHVQLQRGMLITDRGNRVKAAGVEPEDRVLLCKLVVIHYRWNRNRWEYSKHTAHGHRKLPSGGYGGVMLETTAMHPDIRDLAVEFGPRWKPTA
jgi:hypothetical protein